MLNNRDFDVDGMRCYWHFGEELLQFGEVDCDEIYNNYNDVAEHDVTGFEIYPNPANNIITIVESNRECLPMEFTITNMTGQIIMTGVVSSDNHQVNVKELPTGIYLIKIGEETIKFIKM